MFGQSGKNKGISTKHVVKTIEKNEPLYHCEFSDWNLGDQKVKEIVKALKKNTMVSSISFKGNIITDGVAKKIVELLKGDNRTITSINLENNLIKPETEAKINECIETNRNGIIKKIKVIVEGRLFNETRETLEEYENGLLPFLELVQDQYEGQDWFIAQEIALSLQLLILNILQKQEARKNSSNEEANVWREKGVKLFKQKKHYEAKKCFEKAKIIENGKPQGWHLKTKMGLDFYDAKTKMELLALHAIEHDPMIKELHKKGKEWFEKGEKCCENREPKAVEFNKAIELFDKILEIDPDDERIRDNLKIALDNLGWKNTSERRERKSELSSGYSENGYAYDYVHLYCDRFGIPTYRPICDNDAKSAMQDYMDKRGQGTDKLDDPEWPFPEDGCYSWGERTECVSYSVEYDAGLGDKKWMKEKDQNHLKRSVREKFQHSLFGKTKGQTSGKEQEGTYTDSSIITLF